MWTFAFAAWPNNVGWSHRYKSFVFIACQNACPRHFVLYLRNNGSHSFSSRSIGGSIGTLLLLGLFMFSRVPRKLNIAVDRHGRTERKISFPRFANIAPACRFVGSRNTTPQTTADVDVRLPTFSSPVSSRACCWCCCCC